MEKKEIKIQFDKKCGKIKPMHSLNGGPRSGGYALPFDFSDEYIEMGTPVVRTVSAAGEYGQNQYINVHAIFPDFDADEELEESYNFLPTDLYLEKIRECGAEIFYCFGESSEPYSRKFYAKCPKDKEKWARICAHILMHYNEGWANGFKMGIKYVEIWSAPDSPDGFAGDMQEYFELYRITASYLRERFPRVKIGAFGARGFYALNRLDATEEMQGYIKFMQKFFSFVSKEELPLDFFTWACYTTLPDEIATHARYARNMLDNEGLRRTRSIICEYNSVCDTDKPLALRESFPSELGVALILAQKSSADMMMYADTNIFSRSNALFTMDDHTTPHHYAAYQVMCAYRDIYRLGAQVDTGDDSRRELYSLAATDGNVGSLMMVTRRFEGKVEISLLGCAFDTCSVTRIVPGGTRGKGTIYRSKDISLKDGRATLPLKKNEIYTVSFFTKNG